MIALIRLRTIAGAALFAAVFTMGGCFDSGSTTTAETDSDDEVDSTCVWGESDWDDCDWG